MSGCYPTENKCVDIQLLYTMRQTIEAWQEGCEVLINDLQQRIKELERFQEITNRQYQNNIRKKQPYKCPVCNGKGNIQTEVEPKVLKFELCNACAGKGIVWG